MLSWLILTSIKLAIRPGRWNKRMKQNRRTLIATIGTNLGFFLAATPVLTQTRSTEVTPTDGLAITNAVNRIALMADLRDWAAVRACFTPQVEIDYTSLTGGQPEVIAADDLVARWRSVFETTFKTTQHLLGSHSIAIEGNIATCISHFQARHIPFNAAQVWTLGGHYRHELIKSQDAWLVRKMQMVWTWEEGTRPFA